MSKWGEDSLGPIPILAWVWLSVWLEAPRKSGPETRGRRGRS